MLLRFAWQFSSMPKRGANDGPASIAAGDLQLGEGADEVVHVGGVGRVVVALGDGPLAVLLDERDGVRRALDLDAGDVRGGEGFEQGFAGSALGGALRGVRLA